MRNVTQSSTVQTTSGGGIGIGGVLTIVFLILKLTGTVPMPWFSINLFQISVFWTLSFGIWFVIGFVVVFVFILILRIIIEIV